MSRASARKSRAARTSGSESRKAANERSFAGRSRELLGAHLVGASCDRNRAHGGEIGFGLVQRGGIVGGVYDFRKRSRVFSTGIFALSCTMIRRSSSDTQISACPPSAKSPPDLMIGWSTIVLNVPALTRDLLATQHFHNDRIVLRPKVARVRVRLADDQRDGAHEIEERRVVERIAHALLLLEAALMELGAVGVDLEVAFLVVAPLVDPLVEAMRRSCCGLEPALQPVIHLEEEEAALDVEDRVVDVVSLDRISGDDRHGARADLGAADGEIVHELFAHAVRAHHGCGLRAFGDRRGWRVLLRVGRAHGGREHCDDPDGAEDPRAVDHEGAGALSARWATPNR